MGDPVRHGEDSISSLQHFSQRVLVAEVGLDDLHTLFGESHSTSLARVPCHGVDFIFSGCDEVAEDGANYELPWLSVAPKRTSIYLLT